MLKYFLLIFISIILFIGGCTSTARLNVPSARNCEADMGCFNKALNNNCEAAYWSNEVNVDGNVNFQQLTSENKGQYCVVEYEERLNGQRTNSKSYSLTLPPSTCTKFLSTGYREYSSDKCVAFTTSYYNTAFIQE